MKPTPVSLIPLGNGFRCYSTNTLIIISLPIYSVELRVSQAHTPVFVFLNCAVCSFSYRTFY